jgi:hypothetical protein
VRRGPDRLTLLGPVTARLRAQGIAFAVIGAAAMAVHGVARSTVDVDVLATARDCLDESTWAPLAADGIEARIRRGEADDPLAGVVRLRAAERAPLDVVVGRAAWQAAIAGRAQPTEIDGVVVPVATAADVILLKLYAGGPQDAWDIEQLLATEGRAALAGTVDAAVDALPAEARALWARLRGEAGA